VVADEEALLQRQAEVGGGAVEHPRLGLTAIAPCLRSVWTIEHGVNAPSALLHVRDHARVDVLEGRLGHVATADAALIGDHDDGIAGPVERGDARNCPRQEAEIVPDVDVASVQILVDHAVSIEEDGRARSHGHGCSVAR
jgi:hypothetical protein